MKVTGACACGDIRIEGEINPDNVRLCHCTDCQTGSGSAFRFNVPISGETFRMTGTPSIYVKTTAESGNPRAQAFCPRCGTAIHSTTPGEGQQKAYMVRAGILHQREQLIPKQQIWYRSAQSWVTDLAGVPKAMKQS
ncbi:MAG: GFA family protein [Pseudolabrys sp.]